MEQRDTPQPHAGALLPKGSGKLLRDWSAAEGCHRFTAIHKHRKNLPGPPTQGHGISRNNWGGEEWGSAGQHWGCLELFSPLLWSGAGGRPPESPARLDQPAGGCGAGRGSRLPKTTQGSMEEPHLSQCLGGTGHAHDSSGGVCHRDTQETGLEVMGVSLRMPWGSSPLRNRSSCFLCQALCRLCGSASLWVSVSFSVAAQSP